MISQTTNVLTYIYIYIYKKRARQRFMYIYIYIYVCICIGVCNMKQNTRRAEQRIGNKRKEQKRRMQKVSYNKVI